MIAFLSVIRAQGFATEVGMFEGVDVSGVNTLAWSEDVKFVGFEWWRTKK